MVPERCPTTLGCCCALLSRRRVARAEHCRRERVLWFAGFYPGLQKFARLAFFCRGIGWVAKECPPLPMYVAKQRAPRLLAYLPMPEKSERPVLLSPCQRWPCCPLVAARWPFTSAPLPLACAFLGSPPCVARTEKNPPCAASTEKNPPRVPVVSGRGAGAGAGLRPMYATKKRAPQWLSYLPMSQKNERLWPPSPISGR